MKRSVKKESRKKRKYRRLQLCFLLTLAAAGVSLYISIDGNSAAALQKRTVQETGAAELSAESVRGGIHTEETNFSIMYSSQMNADEQDSAGENENSTELKINPDERAETDEQTNPDESGYDIADPGEPDSIETDDTNTNLDEPDSAETDDTNTNPDEPDTNPDEPEQEKITSFDASIDHQQGKKNAYIHWERVKGAVSYEVQRSKKKSGRFKAVISLGGNRRKYTDAKVNRGQRYYYRVAAVMEDGDKIYTKTLTFECPLAQVSGVKLIRYSTSSIKAVWNQNKDAKYYKVYISKQKSGKYQYAGTTQKTWYRVKNLENNQFYYFRVKACAEKKASKLDSEMSETSEMRTMTYNRTTVFAGDSITTGLSGYGILDEINIGGNKDVIAAVGLNTITFRSKRLFAGQTGMERIILYKPYRVYIMLGINEINYRSWEDVVKGNQEIVEGIQAGSPGTDIVLLATPPVSASRMQKENGFSQIPTYNKKLEEMAESMGVKYYDFTGFLKDSNGCLKSDYASGDGYHWKLAAYHTYAKVIEAYDKSLD